jgi:c-di-GMP-binding flagellar brake protein YcgR
MLSLVASSGHLFGRLFGEPPLLRLFFRPFCPMTVGGYLENGNCRIDRTRTSRFQDLSRRIDFRFMDAFGQLTGRDIHALFKQLEENNVFLSLRLLGKGYQRITVITGLRDLKKAPAFRIDYPQGFKRIVNGMEEGEAWRFKFEFTGKDRVQHSFRLTGGVMEGDDIWLPFPEQVERIQRRQYFRIEPPFGSKLQCVIANTPRAMDIVNISIGGALGLLLKRKKEKLAASPLQTRDTLKDVELIFPMEKETSQIFVSQAAVRRVIQDPDTGLFRYGLEFSDLDRGEKARLTKLVYAFQRLILRKR